MKTIQFNIVLTDAQVPGVRHFLESVLEQFSAANEEETEVDVKSMLYRLNKTSQNFVNDLRAHYGKNEIRVTDDYLKESRIRNGIVNMNTILDTLEARGGCKITFSALGTTRRKLQSFSFTF